MAETKKYYHNLDVDNNKISNLLLNPVTTAQRTSIGATLGLLDQGYVTYDTDLNKQYFWNGTIWIESGTTLLLTTLGTSGAATLIGSTLNIPNYSTDITGLVPYIGATNNVNLGIFDLKARALELDAEIKLNNGLYNINIEANNITNNQGLELPDNTGTLAMSVNGNMADLTGDITLSIPTVTPSALTKTDDTNVTLTLGGSPSTALLAATSLTLGWTGTLADSRITSASTWNAKQNAITFTTIGTSGAATFIANTLNIPQYQAALTNPVTGTGVATRVAFWDGTSSISSNSNLYWDNVNNRLGIGNILPIAPIDLGDITGTAGSISKIALYSHPSYGTYGLGVSPGQLDYVSGGSHVFYSNSPSTSELFRIGGTGTLTATSLTGSGTRMVVSNSIGELSTQTIPSFTSPLTTKGDIYVRDASTDTRLPVGLDTQILLADSTQPTGLKWGTNTAPTPLGYYAAFSDVTDQTATVINIGYPMLLGITDLSNGISVVSGSRVTIANTGIYNIQWSAQFTNPTAAEHDVTIWLRKNGVDVPGSAGIVLVPAKHGAFDGHVLPSWNFLLDVVGGDYYEFVWSTDNTSVYISFQAAGSPPPSTASVVLTVTQQSGIMAGTGMTALNGLTGAVQTLAIGTSGISPAFTSVGTTHTLDIPLASGTGVTAGLLSNTDYNNFGTRAAGGSFVSYYFNGGVAASVATYYQMSPSANIAAAANFTLAGNGLISQWLSDVGNPNRLEIPAGNWNFEMYMSASSAGGTPAFYIELLKYNGSTFTTIANSSAAPKNITGGTSIDLYLTSLAIPQTTLLVTDRLAIRVYIVNSIPGRSVTMYTQDSHVSEVITNFAGGISALNGLTVNTQYFATGTSGTDFNISSATSTHTFNLPTASVTNRGVLSTTDWSTFNSKQSAISLTTTGTSGAATFIGNTLNIPQYIGSQWTTTGTAIYYNTGNVLIGTITDTAGYKLKVVGNQLTTGNINVSAGYIGFSDVYTGADPTNVFQNNTLNIYANTGGNAYAKIGLNSNSQMYFKNTAAGVGFAWYQNITQTNARINNAGNFEQASGFWGFGDNITTAANPTNATQNHTYAYFYTGANVYKTGLAAIRSGKFDMYWQTGSTSGGGYRWYQGTTELASISQAGNFLINTTTDVVGYKLQVVSGDALINTIRIGLGNGQVAGNLAFGNNALAANTTGNFNLAIGLNALAAVTTANSNVAVGADAAKLSTSQQCVIIGNKAMQEANTGQNQTYIGFQCGKGGSGEANVGVGSFTLLLNTGGGGNTGIGTQALQSNVSSSHSTAIGFQASFNNTGAQNSTLGSQVLWANTTGANNVAMGYNAGRFITGGVTTATVVNNSILIGYGVKVAANTETNQIVIGYDATGLGSNTTSLGNSSTTVTGLYGNIRLVSGMATAPANATATGTLGDIRVTASFIYVCTATNTWVRAALATW